MRALVRNEDVVFALVFVWAFVGIAVKQHSTVVVWTAWSLAGVVAAGVKGNPNAFVCALELLPMRLQLGDQSLNGADRKEGGKPEVAFLRNGSIVVESWQSGSTG